MKLSGLIASALILGFVSSAHAYNFVDCAPQVKSANLQVTDAVLTDLSNNELHGNSKFVSLVSSAKASSATLSADQKLGAYLSIIGATSDEDVAHLVGDREINQKYIDQLSKNASLSDAEARLVLGRMSKSLLGQRRD
jgi:hypothetical protein